MANPNVPTFSSEEVLTAAELNTAFINVQPPPAQLLGATTTGFTAVATGAGMTLANGVLGVAASGVAPGTYTPASIVVDATGRILAVNGSVTVATVAPPSLTGPTSARLAFNQTVPLAGYSYTDPATTTAITYGLTFSATYGGIATLGSMPSAIAAAFSTQSAGSIFARLGYADLQTAMTGISYTAPSTGVDSVAVSVNRGAGTSAIVNTSMALVTLGSGTQTASVGNVSITYPATLGVTAGTAATVSGFSITDSSVSSLAVAGELIVEATAGQLTMAVNNVAVAGTGTTMLTLQASLATINSALAGLKYVGTGGTAAIAVTFESAVGSYCPLVATSVSISGSAAPPTTYTTPRDPSSVCPDVTLAPSASVTLTGIWYQNSAVQAANYVVAGLVTCNSGTLSVNLPSGVSERTTSTAQYITCDAVLSALDTWFQTGVIYKAPASIGTDTLTVSGFDQGGNPFSSTGTISIVSGATTTQSGGYVPNAGTTGGGGSTTTTTSTSGSGSGITITQTGSGQAARISDWLSSLGANTFSSQIQGSDIYHFNNWASTGDYTPAGTAAMVNYIVGNSGHTWILREYHADILGNSPMSQTQVPWLLATAPLCPVSFTICSASGEGLVTDLITVVNECIASGSNPIAFVEGLNEPNHNGLPASLAASTQTMIWDACYPKGGGGWQTAGVQIVASGLQGGYAGYGGYLTGYMGSYMSTLSANSSILNVHPYPQHVSSYDDGYPGAKGYLGDAMQGVVQAFGKNAPVMISEFHPTFWAPVDYTNDDLTCYWGLCYFLDAATDWNAFKTIWFSLADHDSGSLTGLFTWDYTTPKKIATALRAIYLLCPDTGSNKHSFSQGTLTYTAAGLQPPMSPGAPFSGGQTRLFQNSSGVYFLFVYNAQDTITGATNSVTITFGQSLGSITEYNLTATVPTAVVQSVTNQTTCTMTLGTEVHLLVIHP